MLSFLSYFSLGIPLLLVLQNLTGEGESSFFVYVLLGLNLTFCAAAMLKKRRLIPGSHAARSPHLWCYAFLLSLALATFFHQYLLAKGSGLQIKTYIAALIWFVPSLTLDRFVTSRQDVVAILRWVNRGLVFVSGTVILAAFLMSIGITFGEVIVYRESPGARVFGPLGDQVGFVSALGFLISYAKGSFRGALFHAVAVALTGTRSALLVIVLAVFISTLQIVWSSRKEKPKRFLYLVLGILSFAVVLFSSFGQMLIGRLSGDEALEAAMSPRLVAVELGIEVFRENPILGIGFGGYPEEMEARGGYLMFEHFQENYISNSTNQFVEVAVNGGILALLLYLTFILVGVLALVRVLKSRDGQLNPYFRGGLLWFLGIVLGNQTAIWLQIWSLPALYFFFFPLLAARVARATLVSRPRRRILVSRGEIATSEVPV